MIHKRITCITRCKRVARRSHHHGVNYDIFHAVLTQYLTDKRYACVIREHSGLDCIRAHIGNHRIKLRFNHRQFNTAEILYSTCVLGCDRRDDGSGIYAIGETGLKIGLYAGTCSRVAPGDSQDVDVVFLHLFDSFSFGGIIRIRFHGYNLSLRDGLSDTPTAVRQKKGSCMVYNMQLHKITDISDYSEAKNC